MPIDVHVHCKGGEDGNKILKAMDEVGLERIVLMSAPPHWSMHSRRPQAVGHRTVIDDIARTVAPDPKRMLGFAWIQPTLSDAVEMVDYALGEKGLGGVKMIPDEWYPDAPCAQECYRRMEVYGGPLLFHSGILWTRGNTSQYCRPAGFEIMMGFPKIRFALAHMSWPWTDECIAVCQKLRWTQTYQEGEELGEEWTCYIDITTGAPRIYKVDAMRKTKALIGDSHLMYGSDCADAENPEAYRHNLHEDREIMAEAGYTAEEIDRVMNTNALAWLGP
jgi:predicted TIM-barrel fold metal-dependent hydrolase